MSNGERRIKESDLPGDPQTPYNPPPERPEPRERPPQERPPQERPTPERRDKD